MENYGIMVLSLWYTAVDFIDMGISMYHSYQYITRYYSSDIKKDKGAEEKELIRFA
jgi:hypothetical protein